MSCATSVRRVSLCIILVNLLFFSVPPFGAAGETIRINGTGSCLEMIRPLFQAYARTARGVSLEMEKPLGSSGALKALMAGAIDIAVTARQPDSETVRLGAKTRRFGKTALVIVTEKSVPAETISTRELENIYGGVTVKWSDGRAVRVILRLNQDIDTKILRGLSPGMDEAVGIAHRRPGMFIAITDPESNEMVSKTPGGVGTAGLAGVLAGDRPLKILALNGVVPSRKTLADGTYPLAKEIYFVTNSSPPRAAAEFLDFVFSNKGRSIAEKIGVLVTVGDK